MNLEKIILEAVKEAMSEVKIENHEATNSGLEGFINKKVLIFTSGYFYTGVLVGVSDTCVKIKDPMIVYETGCFSESEYKDVQKLHCDFWYVQTSAIESFGFSK